MKKIKTLLCVVLTLAMLCVCMLPAMADGTENYLVIGDSIAAGTGLTVPSRDAYGAIVAYTEDFAYKNRGINGYRSSDLLRYLDNDAMAADVAWADIISISIGGNDFLQGGFVELLMDAVAGGDYSGFEEIVAKYSENLPQIIAKIRALNPDAVILLQTLYNPAPEPARAVYAQGVDRLKAATLAYAQNNPGQVEIVDVHAAFGGKLGLINADTIHPNDAGHRLIAQTIVEKLYALGIGAAQNADYSNTIAGATGASVSSFFSKIILFFRSIIDKLLQMFR